jgi:hypothetical protein
VPLFPHSGPTKLGNQKQRTSFFSEYRIYDVSNKFWNILNRCSEKSRKSVDVSLDKLYNYFKEMNKVENEDIEIVIDLNENNHYDVLNCSIFLWIFELPLFLKICDITPTHQLTGTTPLSKIKLNNLKLKTYNMESRYMAKINRKYYIWKMF